MSTEVARTAARAVGGVLAIGAALFAYGALVERNRFTVRREQVPVLDAAARPITVLHLSDLHMAPWQRRKQDWLRSLAAVVEPDLIVNTGDNLGHVDGLEGLQRALEPFRGVPGVYVHGSNDYVGPRLKNPFDYFTSPSNDHGGRADLDTDALERFFDDLGWQNLNNRAEAIELHGSRLELLGTNDAHRGWDRLDLLPGLVEDLRENAWDDDRTGPEAVPIGITHAPYRRVLDAFVTQGAELIFAGHTHGGQVRIPGRPALVTNCDIPAAQAQGLSVWHHGRRAAYLEVSAGVGTSIYAPVRFACRPEAVVVTLTPKDFGYS